MHSHDRTLLAKLGFADKDKQNPLHDLACQYLVQPEQAQRLVSMCDGRPLPYCGRSFVRMSAGGCREVVRVADDAAWEKARAEHLERERIEWREVRRTVDQVETEMTLAKGEAQYRTVVGFVDAVVRFSTSLEATGERWRPHLKRGEVHYEAGTLIRTSRDPDIWVDEAQAISERYTRQGRALSEVKIAECAVGDVLRQIKLYKEFASVPHREVHDTWFVAVAFKPSVRFVDELKREGIRVITLGPKFHEWATAQQQAPLAEVDEL